jgi:hypothetical protein
MSSCAGKAQRLLQQEHSGASSKNGRTSSCNVEYRSQRHSGDSFDGTDDDDIYIDQEFDVIRVREAEFCSGLDI